ncbi:hypothetical protein CRENBAI_012278 [Crenichthys baileyi]|uniref:Uncharacterized protein n=1 Tax=Crenichthys baileyi TaxID=28760 RepID=A0AAV9S779_9TELE
MSDPGEWLYLLLSNSGALRRSAPAEAARSPAGSGRAAAAVAHGGSKLPPQPDPDSGSVRVLQRCVLVRFFSPASGGSAPRHLFQRGDPGIPLRASHRNLRPETKLKKSWNVFVSEVIREGDPLHDVLDCSVTRWRLKAGALFILGAVGVSGPLASRCVRGRAGRRISVPAL